jgi:hypothetical protein
VIGARGRNWPIREGKDQVKLVHSSVESAANTSPQSRRSTVSQPATNASRSHSSSITSVKGSEKRELSLFGPTIEENEQQVTPKRNGPAVAVRASAKPASRDLTDILSGAGNDMPPPGSPSGHPRSPRKNSDAGAPKVGAGKSYHPIRLFDEEPEFLKSPEKSVKTNPKKFNHFDFGNGETAVPTKVTNSRAAHASQWDFSDFVTPNKPRVKVQAQNVRTFGWSDDEVICPMFFVLCVSNIL